MRLTLLFGVYHTVNSFPVPQNPTKSRVGVPLLLLAFVSLLFILFLAKWFYIMWRRHAKRAGGSCTTPSLWSRWFDNFSTTSPWLGKLFPGSKTDMKSGFLIGLLGSPAWETRYSAVIFDNRLLFRHPNTVASRRSASGSSPASRDSRSRSFPCSSASLSHVPEENTVIVNNLKPTSPPSPAVTINRSPLLSDSEYMRLLNGRVPASLPFGLTSLVNSLPTNSWTPTSVLTRGDIQAPHLHSVIQTKLSKNDQPSASGVQTHNPTTDASYDDTGDTQPSPAKMEVQNFYETLPFPSLVQRVDRTLTTINEHSSKNLQSQSVETKSKLFIPSLPSKVTHLTKEYSPPPSNRISPKIGPSPLRSMILPPDIYNPFQISSHLQNHQLIPPAHDAIDLASEPTTNVDLSRIQTPASKKSVDQDSLLDLMTELAQETSAWDSNVFMDENFKKLLARSTPQVILREKMFRYTKPSWRSSRHRKVQNVFSILEDIPEVDGVSIGFISRLR